MTQKEIADIEAAIAMIAKGFEESIKRNPALAPIIIAGRPPTRRERRADQRRVAKWEKRLAKLRK